jgi:transcription factor MYB, plant
MRRQVPCLDQVPLEGSSTGVHPCSAGAATPFMDAHSISAALAPYDWAGSGLASSDGALPLASDIHACSSSNAAALPPLLPFDQPPYAELGFPGLPAGWNMAPGFDNVGTTDHLAYQELLPVTQPAPMMLPFFGTEYLHGGVKAELPDAGPDYFFDDLPPDMFDSLDQPPPPLSPPATS